MQNRLRRKWSIPLVIRSTNWHTMRNYHTPTECLQFLQAAQVLTEVRAVGIVIAQTNWKQLGSCFKRFTSGAGEIAQPVKLLLSKNKDLSSTPSADTEQEPWRPTPVTLALGRERLGRSPGLTGYPATPTWPASGQWEILLKSKREQGNRSWGRALKADLLPPHTSTHLCSFTPTCTQIHT